MANHERSDWRDKAYSEWHRSLHDDLSFMDVDWIEWCKTCYRLLAVYELKLDTPVNAEKSTWVTKALAKDSRAKGFLVLYSKDAEGRIAGFRVRQLYPLDTKLYGFTPEQWADRIYGFRDKCHPIARPAPRVVTPAPASWDDASFDRLVW